LFGAERNRGLRLDPKTLRLEVVTVGQDGATLDDVLVHDETNPMLATLLARMPFPEFPVALGVLYATTAETYEERVAQQRRASVERFGKGDLKKLLSSGETWTV
jgi:2-oxoglutarate ferredoxin oxidoreductase subunit beta